MPRLYRVYANLAHALLDNDDDGVSEGAYNALLEVVYQAHVSEFGARGAAKLCKEIADKVEATDGRFYFKGE